MSTEKRKSEKQQYNDLHAQVYSAYESASPEVKQTIDDWAQSLASYESADPLSNSHARKLHIDTYQRMLKYMQSENPYDPTILGVAKRNGFGRYSNDDITRIGNQLAYKFFNQDDKPTSSTTATSTTSTRPSTTTRSSNESEATGHHSFVWNKGLNSDFLLDSDTWNDKASIFADALLANFTDALEKKNNGYAVHNLPEGTTTEDLANAITTLGAVKNVNWDTPNEQTKNVFNALREVATKFNFDSSEFSYYFNVSGTPTEETDPKKAAHQAKLKELGLKDTPFDTESPTYQLTSDYLKRQGWQALTDSDGNNYIYDSNYNQIKPATGHTYIDMDPDSNSYNYGFFIMPDGTYQSLMIDQNAIDWNSQLGKQLDLAIGDVTSNKRREYVYDPYVSYTHQNGEVSDPRIQTLVDAVADQNQGQLKFVDVSAYFRGDKPVILALPLTQNLEYDIYGNPLWPTDGTFYYLDGSEIKQSTLSELKGKGYDYKGYGTEKGTSLSAIATQADLYKHANEGTINFNINDNAFGYRTSIGRGPEALLTINDIGPKEWAEMIIGFIENPSTTRQFKNKSGQTIAWKYGHDILKQLGYNNNPSEFIQGLYRFIVKHNIEDQIGRSKMRKLFEIYNSLVPKAQYGTVLDIHGQEFNPHKKPVIVDKPQTIKDQSAKGTGQGGLAVGSVALDVLSLISSFCPGAGTAISAASGIGSSIMRLIMDLTSDGADAKDFVNFALNFGTDAVSLVNPAAKFAKVARGLAAALPAMNTIWSAVAPGSSYVELANKVAQGKDLSMQDYATLAQGMALIATNALGINGIRNYHKHMKLKGKTAPQTETKLELSVKNKNTNKIEKIEIKQSDYDQLKKAKGTTVKPVDGDEVTTTDLDEATATLQHLTGRDDIIPIANQQRGSGLQILKKFDTTENPYASMDVNTLKKVSSVSSDEAAKNLGRVNRYFRTSSQRNGGKLDRLQQYINKK